MPIKVSSTELSNALQACQNAGRALAVFGHNAGDGVYIQLYDANDEPSPGAIPFAVIYVPAGSNFSFDIPHYGIPFGNGLVVASSTTPAEFTAAGATCFFTAIILL